MVTSRFLRGDNSSRMGRRMSPERTALEKKFMDKIRLGCVPGLAGVLSSGANVAVFIEVDGKGNPIPGGEPW